MIGVYKITSPTGRIYVGSSINIEKRWKKYMNNDCKSQIKLYNSLLKYGAENHVFEILEECELSTLLERDCYYAERYDSLDYKKGLNLKIPNKSETYKCVSDISRKRMSDSSKGQIPWNKGIPLKKETKEKMSKSLIGRKAWNKGLKFSNESKIKMSISSIGQKAWNRKIVLDLSNGIFYNSCTEASNFNNIKRTTLQAMLDGQNKNKTTLRYV